MADFYTPRNPRDLQLFWLQHALTTLESELWRIQWYQMGEIFECTCKITNVLNSRSYEIRPHRHRDNLLDWDSRLAVLHEQTFDEFKKIYQMIAVIKNVLELPS